MKCICSFQVVHLTSTFIIIHWSQGIYRTLSEKYRVISLHAAVHILQCTSNSPFDFFHQTLLFPFAVILWTCGWFNGRLCKRTAIFSQLDHRTLTEHWGEQRYLSRYIPGCHTCKTLEEQEGAESAHETRNLPHPPGPKASFRVQTCTELFTSSRMHQLHPNIAIGLTLYCLFLKHAFGIIVIFSVSVKRKKHLDNYYHCCVLWNQIVCILCTSTRSQRIHCTSRWNSPEAQSSPKRSDARQTSNTDIFYERGSTRRWVSLLSPDAATIETESTLTLFGRMERRKNIGKTSFSLSRL